MTPDRGPRCVQILACRRHVIPAVYPRLARVQVVRITTERDHPMSAGQILPGHASRPVAGDIDTLIPQHRDDRRRWRGIRAGPGGSSPVVETAFPRHADRSTRRRGRSWRRYADRGRGWCVPIPWPSPACAIAADAIAPGSLEDHRLGTAAGRPGHPDAPQSRDTRPGLQAGFSADDVGRRVCLPMCRTGLPGRIGAGSASLFARVAGVRTYQ